MTYASEDEATLAASQASISTDLYFIECQPTTSKEFMFKKKSEKRTENCIKSLGGFKSYLKDASPNTRISKLTSSQAQKFNSQISKQLSFETQATPSNTMQNMLASPPMAMIVSGRTVHSKDSNSCGPKPGVNDPFISHRVLPTRRGYKSSIIHEDNALKFRLCSSRPAYL